MGIYRLLSQLENFHESILYVSVTTKYLFVMMDFPNLIFAPFLLLVRVLCSVQSSHENPECDEFEAERANLIREMSSVLAADYVKVLTDKAVEARLEAERVKAENVRLEERMKGDSQKLWLTRVRAAIASFEKRHGSGARVSNKQFARFAENRASTRMDRDLELTFKWIFENKQCESEVEDLMRKINESTEIADTDAFSQLIAYAYGDISVFLHKSLCVPGFDGDYDDVEYATRRTKMNHAVKLFWSIYEFRDYVERRLTSFEEEMRKNHPTPENSAQFSQNTSYSL